THPAPTDIYTLSLHDALPISLSSPVGAPGRGRLPVRALVLSGFRSRPSRPVAASALQAPSCGRAARDRRDIARADSEPSRPVSRSEEHTSELQSLRHLVCRLL